jgi:hypothetical protein
MNLSTRTVLLLLSSMLASSSLLQADGGAVRLSERQGGYQITVFTAPTPLRAGPVDLSVLVQDAQKGEVVAGARVTVRVAPRGRPGEAQDHPATTAAATNKLFQAALFDLPEPGWWEVEIAIEGPHGPARVRLELEAAEPLPRWLALWPWLSWPILVIILFGVHQLLVRRRLDPRVSRREDRSCPTNGRSTT